LSDCSKDSYLRYNLKYLQNVFVLHRVRFSKKKNYCKLNVSIVILPSSFYCSLLQSSYCARYELTEVRPACHKVGDGHKDQQWTRNLTKGATLCVECQSMAMQSKIGGRCYGHGAYLRTTHWSAVTAPGCYGSWIMTSQREDCHCEAQEKGALSFILV